MWSSYYLHFTTQGKSLVYLVTLKGKGHDDDDDNDYDSTSFRLGIY